MKALRLLTTIARRAVHQHSAPFAIIRDRYLLIDEHQRVPLAWLRDHCMCDRCYNHKTSQRSFDILQIEHNQQAVALDMQHQLLSVTWPDGHVSKYDMDWLRSNWNVGVERWSEPQLWRKETFADELGKLPAVDFQALLADELALKRHLTNLVRLGVSVVSGAPATEQGTVLAMERTAMLQMTVYGRYWTFSNETALHADTAYSSDALGAHTDLTYYNHAPGIQIFHILQHDGTGGKSLLVDGFQCVEVLRRQSPEAFQWLSTTAIPQLYVDAATHSKLYSELPTIVLHPVSGRLLQLRYNMYDRAPMTNLDAVETEKFYRFYPQLTKVIRDAANELWLQLTPGNILFIDNWRVMHGRSAFTGKRVMTGGYLNRDEFLSRARVFGVL